MMELTAHSQQQIQHLHIGAEKTPLLVIDNLITEADQLRDAAAFLQFEKNSPFYPGLRAPAPEQYQSFIVDNLGSLLRRYFGLPSSSFHFSCCHYSLVTQPSDQLHLLQRIPHFDSVDPSGLAAVHYLFKKEFGGTAFYRHIPTGFERIDPDRKSDYFQSLQNENGGPNMPSKQQGYINGDTALFQKIGEQAGIFNRIIIYPRNVLHSGAIPSDFIPSTNPLEGRLSINCFIDCQ